MTELGVLRNLKIDSSFRPSLKITLDRFSFVDGTELPDDHEKMTDEVLKETTLNELKKQCSDLIASRCIEVNLSMKKP